MSQISAIIADDEKELRTFLISRLAEVWPSLSISGEAENGEAALELIEKIHPDIAFLDIRMPGLSGMDVAEIVAGRCRIVFITAYDQYAVEAFENNAVDYLLKPVTEERLEITVTRIKKQLTAPSESSGDISEELKEVITRLKGRETSDYLRWIRVQQGNSVRLISIGDVCYFKASDKYTVVMTASGEFLIKKPIKNLAGELDPELFWRIHRGTIVNVSCIDRVSRSLSGKCVLKLKTSPETLTVSRTYCHLFKQS